MADLDSIQHLFDAKFHAHNSCPYTPGQDPQHLGSQNLRVGSNPEITYSNPLTMQDFFL